MVTNNQAEYLSFIAGLQYALQQTQSNPNLCNRTMHLTLYSRSQLVVDQMDSRSRVKDDTLLMFNVVVKALACRFGFVQYEFLQERNNLLDRAFVISKINMDKELSFYETDSSGTAILYRPCLMGMVKAYVMGCPTVASHDMGAAGNGPSNMIDLKFLQSIPHHGEALLRNMGCAFPLKVVVGKVDMSVIGTVSLKITVQWPDRNERVSSSTKWVQVVVVDSLPVPLHVTTNGSDETSFMPEVFNIQASKALPLQKEAVPEPYNDHPYWEEDVIIMPPGWGAR